MFDTTTPAMQSEHAFLILIQNGEQKELYSLFGGSITTLGRATDNTMAFVMDDRCSRFHAEITFSEGQWYIQDLGSRNGTYVDGGNIGKELAPLFPGQRIQVGHTLLQFGCGEPNGDITEDLGENDEDGEHNASGIMKGSGVFGVTTDSYTGPRPDASEQTEILHKTERTSLLQGEEGAAKKEVNVTTRSGYGPVELCRLAYNLGHANEVDKIAKVAIEGLINATGAEGAGLWLFPNNLNSSQQASDIRLVANATLEQLEYRPVSVAMVCAVFEKKDAFLLYDVPKGTKQTKKNRNVNNTIVAPIQIQNGILGLLHIYTIDESKRLEESDLEYTMAVADTVGTALIHLNKQKELAANLNQVQKENSSLREMLQTSSEIIGESSQIKMIHHLIAKAAEGSTSLLIRGESGVGKELVARAVHFTSARKSKPLVCLNCAAIPETLLASELFGHEKGAFTGATERKIGKFEAANNGTLFLDEIGEMSQPLQAKFLRVLEGGQFERVGGNSTIKVDVRIIAATNRDLEKEIAGGRFRYDLFFRLRVLEIIVPPLRKRTDDIPILAQFFLEKYCKDTGRKYLGFSSEAIHVLMNYRWPGNIRELKNVIERAVVLGTEKYIQERDLLLSSLNTMGESGVLKSNAENNPHRDIFIPLSLEDVERSHIIKTLDHVQWNKSLAAEQLGIERTTLDRKIKKFGLKKDEGDE